MRLVTKLVTQPTSPRKQKSTVIIIIIIAVACKSLCAYVSFVIRCVSRRLRLRCVSAFLACQSAAGEKMRECANNHVKDNNYTVMLTWAVQVFTRTCAVRVNMRHTSVRAWLGWFGGGFFEMKSAKAGNACFNCKTCTAMLFVSRLYNASADKYKG